MASGMSDGPCGIDALWLNGRLMTPGAVIGADDRGLLLADGVFDTSLVLGGRVFRASAHLDRLMAAALTLRIPVDRSHLVAAMASLACRRIDGSLRLTVTRGPAPRGLTLPAAPQPTLLGTTAPLTPAVMFRPIACSITAIARNETSPAARIKSLAYLDAVLANDAVRSEGAQEALFLNTKGKLACSSLANLFVCRGDALLTPPLEDGVLDGIIRRWVLENAAGFGLEPQERSLIPADIAGGEMVLTNSLRLIAPARYPDDMAEPSGHRLLALMEGLCTAISAECGVDPRDRGATLPDG